MGDEKIEKKSIWSAILDYFMKAVFLLIPLLVGIREFNRQQKLVNIAEFKKSLWLNRLDSYKKTSEAVGKIFININKDKDAFLQSIHEFGVLYWGELYLNEDSTITRHVIKFKDLISGVNDKITDPTRIKDITDAGTSLLSALKKSQENELNILIHE